MQLNFSIYCLFYTLIDLGCLYYLAVFNIVYDKASLSWLIGGSMSVIIDIFIFSVFLQVIWAVFRSLARKYDGLRYNKS